MIYTKPTIVALSAASVAIQHIGNKGQVPGDNADPMLGPLSTGNSYDLDE